jgi:hypothetical protein
MSAAAIFKKLREALDEARVPYFVTGSFVSSAHGVPRSTNDIDIVIAPTREQLSALLTEFPEAEYYSDRDDAFDALKHRSQFNIIDQKSFWKVDFIVSKDEPFDRSRFERRSITEIAGVNIYAASPEDILIAKLRWAKLGGSERQLEDAAGVIRMQADQLDMAYVAKWVQLLELDEQWRAAARRAG